MIYRLLTQNTRQVEDKKIRQLKGINKVVDVSF